MKTVPYSDPHKLDTELQKFRDKSSFKFVSYGGGKHPRLTEKSFVCEKFVGERAHDVRQVAIVQDR